MEVKILGAGKEVTGSCYALLTNKSKIFIDCGMFQGDEELEKLNFKPFDFNVKEFSALLLTHAHLDHCGRIPLIVKSGFRGYIYATDATKALAFIVMADSAKIATEDTLNENKIRAIKNLPAIKPTYSMNDVMQAMKLFKVIKYDEVVKISEDISAKFYDAGHILGSSSIQVIVNDSGKEKTIVFSGDLGNKDSILVKHTEPIYEADYVFMESTYGDRLHDPLQERKKELIRVIKETYNKNGKLMIPSFAIERTQELLYYLNNFRETSEIPNIPVFLDSPMAIKSTEVFKKFTKYFNSDVQKKLETDSDVFGFPGLKLTTKRNESIEINSIQKPCIIIAGSGMCNAGRIKHHIANNIENENNTLLFVGFQVPGTLGNLIKNGEKDIEVLGRSIRVKAKIEYIDGFSAHADRDELYRWLDNFKKKPKVFLIHGDYEQQVPLSKNLTKNKFENYIPSLNEVIKF
jgi:metallo-beta-lactamase family protein